MLRRGGQAAAVATGAATLASPAAAAPSWRDRVPEHVSIEFDEDALDTYRPALNLRDVDRGRLIGLYGWTARSPEYDTDAHVFWTSWTHQTGVTSYDSHRGDHEPFYVFVDSETGDVESVTFSYYHWNAQHSTAPPLYDGTHAQAYVVSPWHQYQLDATATEFVDVLDLTGDFQAWLDNGLAESLGDDLVVEPWRMRTRGYWWKNNPLGFSFTSLRLSAQYSLGIARDGGPFSGWL